MYSICQDLIVIWKAARSQINFAASAITCTYSDKVWKPVMSVLSNTEGAPTLVDTEQSRA